MLTITEYDQEKYYRILKNSPGVFHEALKYVLKGETHFHVSNENGEDFDLLYLENDRKAKSDESFPDSSFFKDELIFPPYFFYDETDDDKVMAYLLEGFDEIFFEEANEYTVTIAGIALRKLSCRVTFRDRRAELFPWLKDRVRISPEPEAASLLYVQKDYYPVYITRVRYDSLGLFHSMFMLQWLTDLPKDKIRYLELFIRKTEGIGSLLTTYIKVRNVFDKIGIKVYLAPDCTRYSDRMLGRYFVINQKPQDADETNTAYVKCFNCFALTGFIQRDELVMDLSVFQPAFLREMKEYADYVIGSRKVLGVLLRGTDYIIANFAGAWHVPDIEDCIRIVSDRMEQYGYDRIILATEDKNFLERMLREFPGKVVAIAQERHRVSDFRSGRYLAELEKQESSPDAYSAVVEDNAVNYMYAMYIMSRCESLLANCLCNGVIVSVAFNQGKYVRKEIVSEMLLEGS